MVGTGLWYGQVHGRDWFMVGTGSWWGPVHGMDQFVVGTGLWFGQVHGRDRFMVGTGPWQGPVATVANSEPSDSIKFDAFLFSVAFHEGLYFMELVSSIHLIVL